jgi:hypothetical protein
MTNLEIKRQAQRFAAQLAQRSEFLDPEDAWYRWSAMNRMASPAARHVFEQSFRGSMAKHANTFFARTMWLRHRWA